MSARGHATIECVVARTNSCATEQQTEGMSMAARMAVTAGIAGTAVIVSGIIGVVTITDLGARADNAGSRVSVAKIDVVAPSHPTPFPVVAADSDIPAPAAPETVTVPAPEPGEILTSPAKASKTTAAKSEASGNRRPASGQHSSGQDANGQGGQNGHQNSDQTAGNGAGGQSRLNAPVMSPKLVQRDGVIAQAPVHGNGRDNGKARGHDKSFTSQSRESSPAHRD